MMVVDASVILEIFRQTTAGLSFEESLDGHDLHAPHVIDLEVAQTLRRWELRGDVSPQLALKALETLRKMPITRHPHTDLLAGIWALRHNLTAYDAAYLVLARRLGAELLTMDEGLRKATSLRNLN